MKEKHLKFKSGFSLIEALIAIAILVVGILSAFLLLIRTTTTIPAMQARLTAVNLAQEGVEEVRALRDSDFISGKSFKSFLTGHTCSPSCYISSNNLGKITLWDGLGGLLKFDNITHLYSYTGGADSIFTRQITFDTTQATYIGVTVEVDYTVKGKSQTIMATDRLYNWLNP